MVLLNKNKQSTYGTHPQSSNVTFEPSKLVPNNGYNSHGSSTTTKSSSDNSGSVRTGSGSEIDEESDEEHTHTAKKTGIMSTNISQSNPILQRRIDSGVQDIRNEHNASRYNDRISTMRK